MQFYLASSTTVVFSYKAHRDFSPHFKPRPSHKPKPTKLSPVTLQWDWYKAEVYHSKDPLGFGLKQTRPPTHIILEAKKKERGKNSLDSRSWNSWAACMFYLIIVFILLSHEIYLLISGFCGQKMMKAGADRKCVCVCVCVQLVELSLWRRKQTRGTDVACFSKLTLVASWPLTPSTPQMTYGCIYLLLLSHWAVLASVMWPAAPVTFVSCGAAGSLTQGCRFMRTTWFSRSGGTACATRQSKKKKKFPRGIVCASVISESCVGECFPLWNKLTFKK